eukprot:3338-Amphidinium_carterae.3
MIRTIAKTWDETKVREYDDVVREAKNKNETRHVGRVFGFFGIAGIKGHELPVGHAQRKYKGRYVFQGNNVKDQDSRQQLGDIPGVGSISSMEVSKILDFHSLKNF